MNRKDYEFLARSLREKREAISRRWAVGVGGMSDAVALTNYGLQILAIEDYLVEVLASGDATFQPDRFRKASQPIKK